MRLGSIAAPLDRAALLAVANTRHGREARRPIPPSPSLALGEGFDRLRSSAETVRFLDALGTVTPHGLPNREQLLRLKLVREAVRALAEGDDTGYARRLRRLLADATYRIDEGVLRPIATGWDAFVMALFPVLADIDSARARLKVCHNTACGWVFIDATLNGTQVWCGMQRCGSRMRVRRHRRGRVTRSSPRAHHT